MADKPNDPTTKPKSLKELQGAYDALAKQCGAFAPQTTLILRAREAETKKIVDGRKRELAALLAKKLVAYTALEAAKAAPVNEEPKSADPTAEK